MFSGENEASWATLGWMRRSLTPGSVALAGAASLNAPKAAMSASASAAKSRRSKSEPALADAPQRRGRSEYGNGQEREPVQADERGDLSQPEIRSQRHAEVVPGKAGEEEAARPLGEPEPERERENARRSRRP